MVGTKADSNSYKTIATEIGKEPDEILFLTDSADGELTLCIFFKSSYFFYKLAFHLNTDRQGVIKNYFK